MWPGDYSGVKWLYPGMKIKRWFLLAVLGSLLIALGFALLLSTGPFPFLTRLWHAFSFFFDQLPARRPVFLSLLILLFGVFLALTGLGRAIRSVVQAVRPGQETASLASTVYARRQQQRGRRIVGIGGGTGLATLLRGLKTHTTNLTALVTVADSGGSSGRLRTELGVLPPGDVRRCLVALADTEPLMERLFQYRFDQGGDLSGHNFGNLFIAALTAITGDFEAAVKESSKVLAVQGQVLPATLENVALRAELADGRLVAGEHEITEARGIIRRVWLAPSQPEPLPEALAAIEAAEIIVLGPGSLYTSIIPNLLVGGVADAIRRSPALKVYVCNVMTQPGETDGYTVSAHVQAILGHAGRGLIDYVLVNTLPVPPHLMAKYQEQGAAPVAFDAGRLTELGVVAVTGELASLTDLVRHDSPKLAQAILALPNLTKWKTAPRGRLPAGGGSRDAGKTGTGK